VQACNALGCGNWSEPLEGTTSDGSWKNGHLSFGELYKLMKTL
ncbi:hypothetical protein TNCT_95241, partial [Trichonephila clavata]